MNKKLTFLMFLVLVVGMMPFTSADTIESGDLNGLLTIENFEIDGDDDILEDEDYVQIERGQEIEIEFTLQNDAGADIEDIEVEARIGVGYRYAGQEYDKLYDFDRFDLAEGSDERVKLTVEVPVDIDMGDVEDLRITIDASGDFESITKEFDLRVQGLDEEDAVQVTRASFSPDVVRAGFGFTTLVKVENYGDDEYDDVCATVEVVGLAGAKDTECIDQLDEDDTETLEEFAIRIPEDAKPGTYDVRVDVEFDKYQGTTYFGTIEVVEGYDVVTEEDVKLVVNVPESLEANAGSVITYPVTLSNQGSVDTTIVLSATNVGSFGTARFEPSNLLILKAGETEAVMLNIDVAADAEGMQTFLLSVEADGDSKQVALMTDVKDNGSDELRRGLEIGLIILVIILIILGLIVGFTRMKKGDGEEETQTYY